ncbi:MAG: hypothetical protein DWQ37_03440 [Planctomycetota bacterium]|nr:MAG: hypothetical protein DWQ37_03440 [Planctomycetota bacterium]
MLYFVGDGYLKICTTVRRRALHKNSHSLRGCQTPVLAKCRRSSEDIAISIVQRYLQSDSPGRVLLPLELENYADMFSIAVVLG